MFKKIYWNIQQSDVFELTKLAAQLEDMRESPDKSCSGGLYFVRPENRIGGL